MDYDPSCTTRKEVVSQLATTAKRGLELSPEPVHSQIKDSLGSTLALLATLVLSVAVYFATASSPSLMDDDVDATHALVAREMLQKHDYVVMYMNGVRYLFRAPLHFWLVAGSYRLFGESEFTTRLPSALAVPVPMTWPAVESPTVRLIILIVDGAA